jgi:hypothetical protein
MGETIGIWIGDDESILDDFDGCFGGTDGTDYSRSRRIKDAMRLAIAIEGAIEDSDADLDVGDRPTRMMLRQAIIDEFRE